MRAPMPRARRSARNSSASAFLGPEEVGARKLHAFFELHIEQGPILEKEGVDIGVVTHGQGLKWLQVTLTGRESHTGSTPHAHARQCRPWHGPYHPARRRDRLVACP